MADNPSAPSPLSPDRALRFLLLAQIALWAAAPLLAHDAPPLDVVEMYAWGREGVVATFKHPNLPGLVLEAVRGVAPGWQPAFIVSQLFVALTLWAVYALGKELMDAPRALAGTLMLTGVYFFSWPTPEFNHNVAQMPFWALTALTLWRATTSNKIRPWLLLGVFAGLSLWAKYSSGILIAIGGVWMLWDANARKTLTTPGPWLGLLVFAAVIAPQVLWLYQNEWLPFAYAARRAANSGIEDALLFLPAQAAHHLPLLLLLLAIGWFGKPNPDAPPAPEQRALRFLLLMGLGPLLLTAMLGLVGAGLKTAWGAPMLNLSGLLIVALMPRKFSEARLKRLSIGAGVVLVLLSGLYFAHMRFGVQVTHEALRGNWPQQRISQGLYDAWERDVPGAPLRYVAGDIWTAGLVGLERKDPPSVLINGDFEISPWVMPAELEQAGVLIVWPEGGAPPEGWAVGDTSSRVTVIMDGAPPLQVHYAIGRPAGFPALDAAEPAN